MSDEQADKLVAQAVEKLNIKIESGDLDKKLFKRADDYLCKGVSDVLTAKVIAEKMENACKVVIKNMKTDGLEKTIKEFLEKATLDACESKEGEEQDEVEEEEQEEEEEDDVEQEEPEEPEKKGGRRRKHKRTRKRKK